MKTYYFCAVATSDTRMVRSFYTVYATHFDAAFFDVLRQTEWLWSQSDYSFNLLEFCVFGFARQKARSSVDAIVLGRNGVKVC